MAKKYKDFDAMFAEMNHETIPFKAFGKIYEIPKKIPASVVLEMARREKDDTLDNVFLFKTAAAIFGQKCLDELTAHTEFSAEMLSEMIRWAFQAINGKTDDDDLEELTEDDTGAVETKN